MRARRITCTWFSFECGFIALILRRCSSAGQAGLAGFSGRRATVHRPLALLESGAGSSSGPTVDTAEERRAPRMNTTIAVVLSSVALSAIPASADPQRVAITGIVVETQAGRCRGLTSGSSTRSRLTRAGGSGMELYWSIRTKPSEGTVPVLIHGRTDNAGRFTLDLSPEIVARRIPPVLAIWTATTGPEPRVASSLLPQFVLAGDSPVRLEPAPSRRTGMIVLDPAGRPLARAKIIPSRASDIPVPEALGLVLAATTDAQGRAFVSGIVPDEVRVAAPGFGVQTIMVTVLEFQMPEFKIPDPQIPKLEETPIGP